MRETVRTMTDDPVVLRIMDQLKIEGKTEKDLVKHLKMANGTFSSWKFANVKSYRKRIGEIASFLGVSSEYLLEGKDDYVIATGVQHTVREFCTLAFHYAGIELEWQGEGLDEKGVEPTRH